MAYYGATNGNFSYSQGGLNGPGTSSYTSNAYGYGYSYEGQNGSVYTHSHYGYGGVTTDFHSYSYHGAYSYYSRESEYRTFPSSSQASYAGYPSPPYSSAYGGYAESIYAYRSLSDVASGNYVDQTRQTYQHETFSSGYSTTYSDMGTSQFDNGSFVTGTATNYSVDTVTNPYGYSTYTPNYRSY